MECHKHRPPPTRARSPRQRVCRLISATPPVAVLSAHRLVAALALLRPQRQIADRRFGCDAAPGSAHGSDRAEARHGRCLKTRSPSGGGGPCPKSTGHHQMLLNRDGCVAPPPGSIPTQTYRTPKVRHAPPQSETTHTRNSALPSTKIAAADARNVPARPSHSTTTAVPEALTISMLLITS